MPQAAIVLSRLAIVLLAAVVLASCFPSHEIARHSRAVVIVAGAKNVEYTLMEPVESIGYDITPPGAIEATRQTIDRELRADGWRADAFESPGTFVDDRKGTREPVEQWRGLWKRGDNIAEYILERRPDRLHVWARIGPPDPDSTDTPIRPDVVTDTVTNTKIPFIPETYANAIEVGANDVAVFCGPRGMAAVALTNVTNHSATATWRFRDVAGHESSAQATVSERPGSKPKVIDASGTHFRAGPYMVTWSPGEVTMIGSRTKPEFVVAATSMLFYQAGVRATKLSGKSLDVVDLSTVCQ